MRRCCEGSKGNRTGEESAVRDVFHIHKQNQTNKKRKRSSSIQCLTVTTNKWLGIMNGYYYKGNKI